MKTFYSVLFAIAYGLILISCGAQSVQPLQPVRPAPEAGTPDAPLVTITFNGADPVTTNLRFSEGQTVEFELEASLSDITSASLTQTAGPLVNFSEMDVRGERSDEDIMIGDGRDDVRFTLQDVEGRRTAVFPRSNLKVEFVAPSIERRTTLTFRFQANTPNRTRTRTIIIIIEDDAMAITLTGRVSKGLISNTRIRLFSIDGVVESILGERQIVEPAQIDETGTYAFTLLPSIDFERLLLYKVKADGADMICDAPQGCRVAGFGETFEVDDDLDLRAYIEVPPFGTTQFVNINILTTLVARSAQDFSSIFSRVNPDDVEKGRREVSQVFGLPFQDFTKVPFVDVTQPITNATENAIRVNMIGAGILGAAFAQSDPDDNDDYLDEIKDFIDDFEDGDAFCQDAPSQTTFSIEDVMFYSLEVARIHGGAETQRFFSERLNGIRNGTIGCAFLPRPGDEAGATVEAVDP